MDQQPVSFPHWKVELSRAALSPGQREAFRREILSYLHHCKIQHAPASAESMKHYLIGRERQSTGPSREALRWFYRAWRQTTGGGGISPGGAERKADSETGAPRPQPREGRNTPPAPGRPTAGVEASPQHRAGGAPAPVSRPINPRPQTWRKDHPPAAAADLGRTPWERDLIKASRDRGFLWRRV